jgi:hypothetical protein
MLIVLWVLKFLPFGLKFYSAISRDLLCVLEFIIT